MKKIQIECSFCKKLFDKSYSEYNRNKKLNRLSYCSISCAITDRNKNTDYSNRKISPELLKHCNNRADEFSPFREFIRRIRKRSLENKTEFDLDLQYLKDLWEKQNGKCAYTNISLKLPKYNQKGDRIYTASIDRINSSIGYIKGNVQYLSTAINFMKNDMTHENTLKLIKLIRG